MKTIDVIRLENFERLIGELADELKRQPTQAEIALEFGISKPYVHQLEKGKRANMREDSVRKIERNRGKDVGWMDNDHSLWPFQSISPDRFSNLPPHWQGIAEGEVRRVIEEWESQRNSAAS